ncbi:hypothetical protein [Longimicrobium sp.]|uniref:hypothetical protein n=1 Tax=Longimicrobium sp. TaxID=2029185 RepID=UPI002B730B45|nr:hypothetical protein [Longimicrobium sp.]HSU13472.1 hypothetical protein [Longimicrobium sp.]
MKKLKLDLDALSVDSFTAFGVAAGAGTVAGRELQPTLKTVCGSTWLESNPTCCPCTPRYPEP